MGARMNNKMILDDFGKSASQQSDAEETESAGEKQRVKDMLDSRGPLRTQLSFLIDFDISEYHLSFTLV